MKGIYFQGATVRLAKDQEDYNALPAYMGNGLVTCCFELTDKEIKAIQRFPKIYIKRATFGMPAQPMNVQTSRPQIPLNYKSPFITTPEKWEDGLAVFSMTLVPQAKAQIIKERKLWITTATYGAKFQPISQDILPPFEETLIIAGKGGQA